MGNWAEEVFAPIEAVYKEQVMQNTWGHLAPQKNTSYKGVLLVSNSGYGNSGPQMIDSKFENLQDNPWIYDSIHEELWKMRDKLEEGSVYRIETTVRNYRWYHKKPIKVAKL